METGLKGPHTSDAIRQRGAIFWLLKVDKFALLENLTEKFITFELQDSSTFHID